MPIITTNDILLDSTDDKKKIFDTSAIATQGGAFASTTVSYRAHNVGSGGSLLLDLIVLGSNDQSTWVEASGTITAGTILATGDVGQGGSGHIPVGGYAFLRLRHHLRENSMSGTVVVTSSLGV